MFMTKRFGIECCKHFFGLSDADERLVANNQGEQSQTALWEAYGDAYYEHPLQILRQEVWHAYELRYYHPGFWWALDKGAQVLDYGCGVGAVSLPGIMAGHHVTLMDASEAVIRYLRYKFAKCANVHVLQLPVYVELPQYDAIICTDVLEHLPNPLAVQEKLWNLLKPGGHALLYFSNVYPHAGHLQESVAEYAAWVAWVRTHARIIEEETYVWVQKPEE